MRPRPISRPCRDQHRVSGHLTRRSPLGSLPSSTPPLTRSLARSLSLSPCATSLYNCSCLRSVRMYVDVCAVCQTSFAPYETRLLAPAVLTLLALLLHQAPALCPRRCVCQNLSPSMATLCAKKGLLAVPATVDRRTVELRLADNYITRLRRQDLANMSGMVDLTLSRNALEEVEAGSFADLRVLRSLYLDGNRLTNISADTLRGLASLRLLTVSFNQLDHIAEGAFDDFLLSMEDLDLSYNSLEKVPWEAIQRMTNLHALGLDHNLLERVVAGSFAHLYKLARLDLSSNRLRTVAPDPLFSRAQGAGGGLLAVSLAGNPLHCNCELLWLRRQERQDLLETCSSPAHLSGRAFWAVGEDEFACEPPLITHHTPRLVVLEGQRATLRCRAVGDPEPRVHWLAPGGRVVGASGRAVVHANGTLEILSASPREDGTFTCFASNAAGEAIANVELSIIHLPRPPNETGWAREPDPGSSDIATPNRPSSSTGPGTNASESKAHHKRRVAAVDVAATSALVRWTAWKGMRGVRMYQVQYNGSADDSYVYRMMSPGSSSCLITGLLPGVGYQVCVLAIYYDGTIVPSVAATRLLGCVDFVTEDTGDGDSHLCSSSIASSMANGGAIMPGQLLGGTMIIIIGGIIVACLLVFTVILVIGYKACAANDGTTKTSSRANGAGATAAGGTSGPAGAADGYSAATAVAAPSSSSICSSSSRSSNNSSGRSSNSSSRSSNSSSKSTHSSSRSSSGRSSGSRSSSSGSSGSSSRSSGNSSSSSRSWSNISSRSSSTSSCSSSISSSSSSSSSFPAALNPSERQLMRRAR
ncbi:unnamed protein product [Lampetra fluviatilis]